jgi:FkbM family methyltransferase
MESDLSYTDTITCHGVAVPRDMDRLSPRMIDVMESNRYERPEVQSLGHILRPDDRVLELGAGVGVVSTVAARTVGPENVLCVEADPGLQGLLRETHRLNGVEGISVVAGAVAAGASGPEVPFYRRENFWASSTAQRKGDARDGVAAISIPALDINALIARFRPTVLVVDIEGAEHGLFDAAELDGVRTMIVEFHPRLYGLQGVRDVTRALSRHGFAYDIKSTADTSTLVFSRAVEAPTSTPRVAAVVCMKNEGPFVLEWVAYHRSIGITDLTIFSNDCTDGTDSLLDRLDDLDVLRHYPNPTFLTDAASHQPFAIQYAQRLRAVRRADWVISMDADEFINIHVGDGTFAALVEALPDADAIALSHLDFGSSHIEHFEDGFVTERMVNCQEVHPDRPTRRGIKTLVGKTAKILRASNHRPVFDDPEGNDLVWYSCAGQRMPMEYATGKNKGIDCRGAYELAQMNHYAVKSYDSYLTKVARGDAVDPRWARNLTYWQQRDSNADVDTSIQRHLPRARQELERLMADPEVRRLHDDCVARHKAKIAELHQQPEMQELLDEMRKSSSR